MTPFSVNANAAHGLSERRESTARLTGSLTGDGYIQEITCPKHLTGIQAMTDTEIMIENLRKWYSVEGCCHDSEVLQLCDELEKAQKEIKEQRVDRDWLFAELTKHKAVVERVRQELEVAATGADGTILRILDRCLAPLEGE